MTDNLQYWYTDCSVSVEREKVILQERQIIAEAIECMREAGNPRMAEGQVSLKNGNTSSFVTRGKRGTQGQTQRHGRCSDGGCKCSLLVNSIPSMKQEAKFLAKTERASREKNVRNGLFREQELGTPIDQILILGCWAVLRAHGRCMVIITIRARSAATFSAPGSARHGVHEELDFTKTCVYVYTKQMKKERGSREH